MRKLLTLPVAALAEPKRPARSEMSDEGMTELEQSIRALGVLQPLLVVGQEAPYEVVAGHRRLLACRAIGLDKVPCIAYPDEATMAAARLHENIFREALSPCDEAIFYAELMEEHRGDIEAVARACRVSVAHVDGRLMLLRGDQTIFEALRRGDVSIGVAKHLNRISSAEDRAYYLEYAIRGGCSIRQAALWQSEAEGRQLAARAAADRATAEPGQAPPPVAPSAPGSAYLHLARPHELSSSTDKRNCMFCEAEHEEWQMYKKHVCAPCAERHLVPLAAERAARG